MDGHHSSTPLPDDGALMRLQQRRFDLLKLELTTLALKIDMAVKRCGP